jgi:2-oxoglutarate dehydrogenase E2 component (dihydrolipoamide succinyltransferase)
LETSKAAVTVEAEVAGFVQTIAKKGDIVQVGTAICQVADSADEAAVIALAPAASHAPSGASRTSVAVTAYSSVRLSRPAAKLIEELGLTADDFTGAGLVTVRSVKARRSLPAYGEPAPASQSGNAASIPGRSEPLSLAKRAEIAALSTGESGLINSTLSLYFDSASIRARLVQTGIFDGSIQPLLLYELSRLLPQWPQFTAYFDVNSVRFYDRVDLGLAIDLGDGLKVVTIKDADTLMPRDIFDRTIDFGLRYIDKRLQADELIGSTITVTDLSSLDILHFKPLINGRQSAIIGIGGDGTQPGHPMSLNMTFDHRVATGRDAATFLKELRTRILTYAPDSAPPVDSPRPIHGGPMSCDTCGIGHEAYVAEFGAQAHMMACFTNDGSLVGICHRCYDGWA